MRTETVKKVLVYGVPVMLALQVLLFLVSWLISAASPEPVVRSLLSSEGIRWFFASFIDNVATDPLIWIILGAMAYGAVVNSHILLSLLSKASHRTYRQAFALRIVLVEWILFAAVIVLLSFVPHAALLSVTGQLFPSSFSHSLIPTFAFCVIVSATTYGLLAGVMRSVEDAFASLCKGIATAAPAIIFYVVAAELYFTTAYVFRF